MDSIPRFIASKHDPSRISYKHPALEPIPGRLIGHHGIAHGVGLVEGVLGKVQDIVINGLGGIRRDAVGGAAGDVPAFNKAHAVCYAVVANQTAWFKCHYPREYMAALLTSDGIHRPGPVEGHNGGDVLDVVGF